MENGNGAKLNGILANDALHLLEKDHVDAQSFIAVSEDGNPTTLLASGTLVYIYIYI